MKLVGVNASDSSVEAVVVEQGWFGRPAITAISRNLLPDGTIVNGVIEQQAALVECLQQLFQSAQPRAITATTVALSIPESQVFSRLLSFPQEISHEQIRATIQEQFSRYLPFEANDVSFDHLMIGQRGRLQDVLLVAVKRAVLQSYEALTDQLHWQVEAFELESISSARAVLSKLSSGETLLLLDVGARTTIASWFDQSGLRYTFNIPIAGHYFTQYLIEQLHIPAAEAETKKCHDGFRTVPTNELLAQAWQPLLKPIQQGIQYVATTLNLPTKAVWLIGGSAQLPGVTDWLTNALQLPTTIPPVLPGLRKNAMVQKIQQAGPLYYNAVGLALASSRVARLRGRINFSGRK